MSAVGPAMLKVAGEVADGARLHPFSTRRYMDEVSLTRIRTGLDVHGRPRHAFEVVAGSFIATGANEEEVAKMREYIRFRVAFYCSTRSYWHVLALHDMEDLGHKLRPYPKEGRWDEMAALISDDVLEMFATVATYDTLADKIEKRYGGLADTLSLFIPPHTDPLPLKDVMQDIQRIATPFKGYAAEWPAGASRQAAG
jgi:alkanesulfonate monooxygenase SsuD/methylene tetrahydromethanopterin reductase-like flavin-dependent oxidoreductase (luciferase family)